MEDCEIEIESITFSPQVESMQLGWEQHCVAQWWWGGLLIRKDNIEENKFEKKRIEKECNKK